MTDTSTHDIPGMFSLVLHTHLPWINNHGRWPVGEEWLYQAWAEIYLPVVDCLTQLAQQGYRNLVTLGMTPILAAQLDSPYSLMGMEHWLGDWVVRSCEAIANSCAPSSPGSAYSVAGRKATGHYSYQLATHAMALFHNHWRSGATPVIRSLIDAQVIELLSGPLTHAFQPTLSPQLRSFALNEGLADTFLRTGIRTQGIWAPECAYKPGLEKLYQNCGIEYFLVDGPAMNHDTALARPVGDTSVLAFARNLDVSYRVWSPTSGYPGHPYYRDFYTYDHHSGLKPARVTGKAVPASQKKLYDPLLAHKAVHAHVDDFVTLVKDQLLKHYEMLKRPGHIVAAFDTELFGHWWHEGPQWLSYLFPALKRAGITVGTLRDAKNHGYIGEPSELGECSWGTGKDYRVWTGPQVADIAVLSNEVVETALLTVAKRQSYCHRRDPINDHIIREALLTAASDWPFLITKNTASNYARDRIYKHAHAVREICYSCEIGDESTAARLTQSWFKADNPFPQLDARRVNFDE